MPWLFLYSAVISGSGACLMISSVGGRHVDPALQGGALILLAAGLAAWTRYLRWSGDAAFVEAIAPLARGSAGCRIVRGGYTAPLVLIALAVLVPAIASPALVLAGALMVGFQFYAKALLILEAGQFRPITFAGARAWGLGGANGHRPVARLSQRRMS